MSEDIDAITQTLGLAENEKSDLVIILQDLMNLNENLQGKSDLKKNEIERILRMLFWSGVLAAYSPSTKKLMDTYITEFMKLKVSLNRGGRKEIIRALSSKVEDMDSRKAVLEKLLK